MGLEASKQGVVEIAAINRQGKIGPMEIGFMRMEMRGHWTVIS